MLEQLITLYLGGIVGAVLMDSAETIAARYGINSGVNVALVGRWALAFSRGRWHHRDIRTATPSPHEVTAGWLFHLFIGGGGVALLLPLAWQMGATSLPLTSPLPYLFFGLATSALPWFILLPSFGWGLWGRRGPAGSNALLASPLSHIPYGLGIWLAVVTVNTFFNING
ncbi:MAG TPA: DUF2938 family protein [Gammaproteobacteria bacterium]